MIKYILKRLFLMIIALIIIITVVFFLLQLMPGYPKAIESRVESAQSPEEIRAILAAYQPDSNSFLSFFKYLGKIFKGDFGVYYKDTTKTIPKLFFEPLKYTMMITGPAFLIGTFFGIVFGFTAGYKRGKWQDITVNIVATFFVAIPSFVLAMFLLLFGNKVGLPISFRDAQRIGKTFLAVILPIVIITITSFSTLTYYIRNEVVEVLVSDFITIARAKGLSERQIFFKHVIKNVSLPFITIVFPSFLAIIFGALIIEVFFDVPGSSSVFILAIGDRERNVIMFSAIFFAAFGLITQLLVDILYVLFDPRIKIANPSKFSLKTKIKAWWSRKRKDQNREQGIDKQIRKSI